MALNLFGKTKKKRPKPKKKTSKKPAKKTRKVKKKKKTVKKKVVKKIKKKAVKRKVKRTKPKKKIKKVKKKPKKITAKPKKVKIKLPEIEKMEDEKAYKLAKASRLNLLKTIFVKKDKDLALVKKIGFPCYMKVSGPSIIHKTEIGGVVKVDTMEEAEEAFVKLMKIKGAEKILVQEYKDGFELILGAKSDPQFGHIVSVGLGGIYVEILKDVKFRICPIATKDAEDMVKELRGYDILAGARGKKPIDFDSLYDLLIKICRFAMKNKIKEMDINPLFCDSKGCYISDIRIIK